MIRKLTVFAALIAATTAAHAGPVAISEGFDSVAGLSGSGWILSNQSTPAGESWFQGNAGIFTAESGADDSYIGANFLSAGLPGTVDNWLITPTLTLEAKEVGQISFSTRTANGDFGDNLSIYYNDTGSTNLADFTLLSTIASSAYPIDWTNFTLLSLYSGGSKDLRFAFRYTVADNTAAGDYIGIDSVSIKSVPEPEVLSMLALGLLMLPLATRRRRSLA